MHKRERLLKERFEAADKQFALAYSRKARLARVGKRPYPVSEFIDDLYRAAGDHNLLASSLWI